jgi:site-specific DNA-cytosine methylase
MSWKRIVDSYGYNSFIKVLNAADYDIPQGRERVFMVSIRKDEIDESPKYYFPKPIERKREIEDFLCDRVPEEYYLSDDVIPKFLDLLYNTGEDFDEKTTEHKHLIKDKEKEHNIDQYGVDEDSIELEEPENTEAKLIESIGYVPVKNENALF